MYTIPGSVYTLDTCVMSIQANVVTQGSDYADVDNQYIAISALQALTAPVPWDATCE
jgi:hypothetical protein